MLLILESCLVLTHLLLDSSRLLASASCSQQIPQNEKPHRLRRLNLAVLNPTTILPTLTARETNLPRDSPTLSDNPTTTLNTSNLAKEEDRHEDS